MADAALSATCSSASTLCESNPLLGDFIFPPFDVIEPRHFSPAIAALLEELGSKLEELEKTAKTVTPSFLNIVDPFENILDRWNVTWGIINHLELVKDTPQLRAAVKEVQAEKVKFELKLHQSKPIHEAFQALQESLDSRPEKKQKSESCNWKTSTDAKKRVLENLIRNGILNGVGLKEGAREELIEIEQELQKSYREFDQNLTDSTRKFTKIYKAKSWVKGLSPEFLASAAQKAVSQGHPDATAEKGPWVMTLNSSSYSHIMGHAQRRELREKMFLENVKQASIGDTDNTPVIDRIFKLRSRKAKLLGYNNYVEVSMETKMATYDTAMELLEKIIRASRDAAVQELKDLKELAKDQGAKYHASLKSWDISYWGGILRSNAIPEKKGHESGTNTPPAEDINEEIKFSFVLVMEGLFKLAKRLFGIVIEAADGIPSWNPDVQCYRVNDIDGSEIGYFYCDPFSRPSEKSEGSWTSEVVGRRYVLSEGVKKLRLPIAIIVCNQTPCLGDTSALMTFEEVVALFHEFGHALQHILTIQDEGLVAGMKGLEGDVVEVPSLFMEKWCYERNTLKEISRQWTDGEVLSEDSLASLLHNTGTSLLQQAIDGIVDLELHAHYVTGESKSVHQVHRELCKNRMVIPLHKDDRSLCSFDHIFSGEYAASYYGYQWADVLATDAFSAFEEIDLNNEEAVREVGLRFRRTILGLGGGKAASEVFTEFRGRKHSTDALFKRLGFMQNAA